VLHVISCNPDTAVIDQHAAVEDLKDDISILREAVGVRTALGCTSTCPPLDRLGEVDSSTGCSEDHPFDLLGRCTVRDLADEESHAVVFGEWQGRDRVTAVKHWEWLKVHLSNQVPVERILKVKCSGAVLDRSSR